MLAKHGGKIRILEDTFFTSRPHLGDAAGLVGAKAQLCKVERNCRRIIRLRTLRKDAELHRHAFRCVLHTAVIAYQHFQRLVIVSLRQSECKLRRCIHAETLVVRYAA